MATYTCKWCARQDISPNAVKKKDLIKLIRADIALPNINTSLINDMSGLFQMDFKADFSGIENWNTSNVVNMGECLFCGTKLESTQSELEWYKNWRGIGR